MKSLVWIVMLAISCSGGDHKAVSAVPSVASPTTDLADGDEKAFYGIEVDGEQVSKNSFRFAYNSIQWLFGDLPDNQRKLIAMELLIQRELLSQAAAKLDFRVSDETVDVAIEAGEFHLLGRKLDGKMIYFNRDSPGNPFFEPEYLKKLVLGHLNLRSVASYKEEQRRELMAQHMRDRLLRSVPVSEQEARESFVMSNARVSADYLKFDASYYQKILKLTPAMVQGYADSHGKELQAEWYKVKGRWEKEATRVELRIIKVARPGASKKSARKVIEAARAKIEGGADFAVVAVEISQDQSASLGGHVGWRLATSIGYGQEVVDATRELAVGQLSPVIETPAAYFLVKIEKRSDQGLGFEQKKFDLAIKASPMSISVEQARAAAEAALAAASSTPLDKLYPARAQAASNPDSIPREIREQISPEALEAMMQGSSPDEAGAPPSLRRFDNVARRDDVVPGLGEARELLQALFGDVAVGALAPEVYSVDQGTAFVVVKLTERTVPDMAVFNKERVERMRQLSEERGTEAMALWVSTECQRLLASGAIKPNDELLVSDSGEKLDYEPCSMLKVDP